MKFEIAPYELVDGSSPFAQWFDELDSQAALKIRTAIARMEAGNMGDIKPVGGGVLERRLTFGPGYRIYFGQDGARIVILLTGGTKTAPASRYFARAAFWSDYLARRDRG